MPAHHDDHARTQSRVRITQRICYAIAGVLGILICYLLVVSLSLGQTHVVSGTVRYVGAQTVHVPSKPTSIPTPCSASAPCTEQVYAYILLDGDATQYRLVLANFPRTQSHISTATGAHLRIWYTQAPFFGTDVIALQQLGPSGPVGPFVASPDYFDPTGRALQMFPLIAILLVLAAVLVIYAIMAPSRAGITHHSADARQKLARPWMR